MEIKLENIDSSYKKLINETVKDFFKKTPVGSEFFLEVSFVSKEKIKALNHQYRKKDQATDVLSFPIWENTQEMPKKGRINLGTIIVCLDIVKENAHKFNDSTEKELEKIIRHSLNHLIGKHH